MTWFQQSFTFLITHLKTTATLAISGVVVIYVSTLIPFFGAFFTSAGFIFLLASLFQSFANDTDQKINFRHLYVLPSLGLALAAFVLIPTNIMMGSVSGLAQGSDSLILGFFIIAVFSVMCAISYIIIAHTVGFIVIKELRFGLALEAALQGCAKKRFSFFIFSCFSAVILVFSILPMGLGIIVSLPLHLCAYWFSFRELYLADK